VFLQPCLQVLFCTLLGMKTDRVIHRVGGLLLPPGDFQVAFGFLNPFLCFTCRAMCCSGVARKEKQ
jgi:hypothetical protein